MALFSRNIVLIRTFFHQNSFFLPNSKPVKKIQSDIVNIENISDRDRESGTVLHKQKKCFFFCQNSNNFPKNRKISSKRLQFNGTLLLF